MSKESFIYDDYERGYCCEECKRFFPALRACIVNDCDRIDRVAHHGGCFLCGSTRIVRVMVRSVLEQFDKGFFRCRGLRFHHLELSPHAGTLLIGGLATYRPATFEELGW